MTALVVGAVLATGCPTEEPPPPPVPVAPTTAPVRRLTEAELNRTLRDLFPEVDVPFVPLSDGEGKGFDGDVARQTPSDLAIEQLRTGANAVSAAAIQRKDVVLPREPSPGDVDDERAAAVEFFEAFAPRALRRPLLDTERADYLALFDTAHAAHNFDVALELLIQALLQSPSFAYRVELGAGPVDVAGGAAVGPYEMASRLSYFLWGTMPDDRLFAQAAANALNSPELIEAEARRMLSDERALDGILSFHAQWLDFDKVLDTNKDASVFPEWNDGLRRALRTEADRFVEDVILAGDGTVRSLFTSTTTRVDAQLAALYGVDPPATDWDPVTLPDGQRAGLVTQGAFLASRAHARQPSPVLRGVYVLERFLCQAPPPPSADIETTPPSPEDQPEPTTNRQRYAQHTFDPTCQNCHAGIDGIGFGLESYDAIGRFRTEDNGFPVDDTGTLVATGAGETYEGGAELASILGDSALVHRCVTRHWLTYSRGRAEEDADFAHEEAVFAKFEESGADVRELLVQIVSSPEFARIPSTPGGAP